MLAGMDARDLQRAIGGVALESAYLERALRAAFSALIGSKYAAVERAHRSHRNRQQAAVH
jgi:hypothetical protein